MRPGLQNRYSYPFIEPFTITVPDGDAGVAATVREMEKLAYGPKGTGSWVVKQAAHDAVRGVERGQGEIESVMNYIRDNFEFRGEFGETLQSPEAIINSGAGDCDCQSTLAVALLGSLGFETRFRTIAMQDDPAGEFSHVYAEVRDKRSGQWIPVDTTVSDSYPGWQPDQVARSRTYGVMGNLGNGGLLGRLFSIFGSR